MAAASDATHYFRSFSAQWFPPHSTLEKPSTRRCSHPQASGACTLRLGRLLAVLILSAIDTLGGCRGLIWLNDSVP
jgi:hypothetical protein